MSRNITAILAVFLLAGGCATTPAPSTYEVWQSRLTEGQALTIQSAVLAAEIFNATYDHSIKELQTNTNLLVELRDKINEARRLNHKAQSWNLSALPRPPPYLPESVTPNHVIFRARNLPVKIDYHYSNEDYNKNFFALKVITLRGVSVMSWSAGTEPVWFKPFDSFVLGDSVMLDVQNLILPIKIDREPGQNN